MKSGAAVEFAYAAADRERLVRSAVRGAVRAVLAGANVDTVLTTDRDEAAEEVRRATQRALDRCACGIEIQAFAFVDLHVPPEVHGAFRDLASAMEDKATLENRALTYLAELVPVARGNAQRLMLDAQTYHLGTVADALGRADRFTSVHEAFLQYPGVTRDRLMFEMYDRILPGLPKCVRPEREDLLLELQFGRKVERVELPL
jgi:membrane protease subunit HflK